MASNTGAASVRELVRTARIRLVAACCSRASASRESGVRRRAGVFVGGSGARGRLAGALFLADLPPRPIGLSLPRDGN
jgi:hypothetical protein